MKRNVNEMVERVRNAVEKIVKSICLEPSKVVVSVEELAASDLICVQVSASDMPRVIGRSGIHIRSLMNIVEAAARCHSVAMKLHLVEPEPGPRQQYRGFTPRANWDGDEVHELLKEVCSLTMPGGADVKRTDSEVATEFAIQPARPLPTLHLQPIVEACSVLFNAIGKAQGRLITVAVAETTVA